MPPGPAYNFLCVLTSAADILSHAARIRAAQAASVSRSTVAQRKRRQTDVDVQEFTKNETSLTPISVDLRIDEKDRVRDENTHSSDSAVHPTTICASVLPESTPLSTSSEGKTRKPVSSYGSEQRTDLTEAERGSLKIEVSRKFLICYLATEASFSPAHSRT